VKHRDRLAQLEGLDFHPADAAERAWTLPPRAYTSPEIYALEVERVFRRSWLPVARADQIAKPGDYLSFSVLGEPLVAVRGQADEVRVLSRVCRHRWMPVVEGAGNRKSFQCPYHLWTYGLDGRLLGAPEMQRAEGFDASSCRLAEVRTEVWEGWVFVNFDSGGAPLAPSLEPLRAWIAPWRVGEMRSAGAPLIYDSPWNWKVMVENFLESYHVASIHAGTLQPIFPASVTFAEDTEGPFAILRNPARDRGKATTLLLPEIPGLTPEQRSELVVFGVFPLHLFALSPDFMVWYQMEPQTVERFALRIHLCVPPAVARDPELAGAVEQVRGLLDTVHREDIRACVGVQEGLRSRYAQAGRFSHLEKALWQFQRFVASRLVGGL
jgi:phenylpropionate dioxygenase-like ring-hydroxylating dioxygenase large terminal subunit